MLATDDAKAYAREGSSRPDWAIGVQPESLEEQTKHILEEARMVIPGIQALFGFQLVAVFNEPFFNRLGDGERGVHLAALAFVLVALISVMCPAAYHRQAEPRSTSNAFNRFAGRCLTFGMFVLMLGVNIDFYIVATLIVGQFVGAVAAIIMLSAFVVGWFVLRACGSQATERSYGKEVIRSGLPKSGATVRQDLGGQLRPQGTWARPAPRHAS